jgi:alpha-glucosidase
MQNREWWKDAVVYQIYPRSFYDGNDDGVGDIQGIIQKLDYLNDGTQNSLGIDALWISPIYPSPMKDCGYDIQNYIDIDPLFGNLDDFKVLLAEAHKRGIKILMDLVLNHTSDQHPWFQESRDKNSDKADWYIWHPGINGKKPNNWICGLELKNAWWWDEKRGEYYLGTFTRFQPEVNFRNPELKKEMYNVVKFWLDLGVDGFRMDVVNWFIKDDQFRSNPLSLKAFPDLFQHHLYDRNRPETHEICKDIRSIADSYSGDKMLVGEIYVDDASEAASYHGKHLDELHMAFNFNFMFQRWSAKKFYQSIERWYQALPEGAWPNFTLSNHDYFRHYSRYKKGAHSDQRAKLAITMLLTLRGTPFLYYGEEIGMENTPVPRQKAMDPLERFPLIPGRARARTPMQWSAEVNAGFSSRTPWLPVNKNYPQKNVSSQSHQPYSLLQFYKKILWLRKETEELKSGDIEFVHRGEQNLLSYLRTQKDSYWIILNFSSHSRKVDLAASSYTNVLNQELCRNNITIEKYGFRILKKKPEEDSSGQ